MNDVKTLKIALVAVFVAGALLGGYSWYSKQQTDRNVQDFALQMGEAQTEQQAAVAVGDFLKRNRQLIAPQSANAGLWGWLKGKLGGGSSSGSSSGSSGSYVGDGRLAPWETSADESDGL